MLTSLSRSTAIRKALVIIVAGMSLSMLAGCTSDSSDDDAPADSDKQATGNDVPDTTNPLPEDEADFTGTWMLQDVNEESFGAWSNNVLQDELKFRKVSRQLVTITQQDGIAQIQLCGEEPITASASAEGLAYDARTYMPTINHVTDLTPMIQPLVLARGEDGTLRGTLDSGLIPVYSEPYPNSYQVTREFTLVRVAPEVNVAGIGSLNLDWSFQVTTDFTTTEQRDDTVSCFVETVRTKSGGEKAYFYGVSGRSTKSLMLDAQTVQVTFTDELYSRHETAHGDNPVDVESSFVQRSVALKLKPVFSAIGFSQSVEGISAEEESTFSETPLLLQQQYTSTLSSLTGTINVDSIDQFMHAQFDLTW
jgi:hypothetical protein